MILRSVSFELHRGEGIGIYGHNGCGKTTLLDILAGVQTKDSGSYEINTNTGYVMQRAGFQEKLTCLDNLRLEAALCKLKGKEASMRIAQCADECDLSNFLNKRVFKCSVGMRARLSIAMALLARPGLLLFDEAFSALDEDSGRHIKDVLRANKENGMSIILVSHNAADYEGLCEYVLKFPSEEVSRL